MVSWGPGVHCRLPTSEQWAGSKSGICQVNHWVRVGNLLLIRKSRQVGFESSSLVIAGTKVDAMESHQECTQLDPLDTPAGPKAPHLHLPSLSDITAGVWPRSRCGSYCSSFWKNI